MTLSKFELYHGAVLTQIVRNPNDISLKLIERDTEKHGWGMYSITAGSKDYILVVKSSSNLIHGRRDYCNFTFSVNDINLITKYGDKNLLVCLVCDSQLICLLTKTDLNLLKVLEAKNTYRISVYWKKGSELTVRSTFEELPHKIARNALKTFNWN